jgi:hypothetical protein
MTNLTLNLQITMKKACILFALLVALTGSASAQQSPLLRLQNLEQKFKASQAELSDFAPALHENTAQTLAALRTTFDKEGKFPEPDYNHAKTVLEQYESAAVRTRAGLRRAHTLRQAALNNNFARNLQPDLFEKAEKDYWNAISYGENQKTAPMNQSARKAEEAYRNLLKETQATVKARITPQINQYKNALNSDLAILNGNLYDPGMAGQADGVVARFDRGNFDLQPGLNGVFEEPTYIPPPPTPPGPTPPIAIGFNERSSNSIRMNWYDLSQNETGNRVMRTADLYTWQSVSERGVLAYHEQHFYTDRNLRAQTKYCYAIESHDAEGARRSQIRCAYTRDSIDIPIWRVQLGVRVANVENAGTNSEISVSLNDLTPNYTYLDYGHDDFERNSSFTYDLSLKNIGYLSDISRLQLSRFGDDQVLIRSICLMVNNGDTIFYRNFGNSGQSALNLSGYTVSHDELRGNSYWNAFLQASQSDRFQNVPPVKLADNGQFQVEISREEIVSRIESLVGNMIHAEPDVRGKMQWGQLEGDAVEISRKSANRIGVDLDLEVPINNWPNPKLDVDFDLGITKECVDDSTMTIRIVSSNFTSNADYALWKDIVSLGTTALTSKLVNYLAKECSDPPEIEQSIEFNLPPGVRCEDLEIFFSEEGNLVICCFSPFQNR